MRWLALANALTVTLASLAIKHHLGPWTVLAAIQLNALCSAPAWSITSSIVFARVTDAGKQFAPIRAMATFGWMVGCWTVSLLNADLSTLSGFADAIVWLTVSAMTFFLPVITPKPGPKLNWHERVGLDALTLLRNRDHRVVFITALLFGIPLAAFYPYAPPHLRALGLTHTSAWMTLGQVTEMIAMFSLGALLLRWRIKWIFVAGLSFGVARFAFSALDTQGWLLLGILLHGCSYTFSYILTQIYLEQRIDPAWRSRAQALLAVLNGGFGNLAGYLGTGWWFNACTTGSATKWPIFWGGLSALTAIILVYFLIAYHGRGTKPTAAIGALNSDSARS